MSLESILLLIASLRNQFIIFSIAISLPSILLYLAEICIILRHKQFRSKSFYVLILFRAIPNLIYTLTSYYFYRMPILFGYFLYPIYQNLPNLMLRMTFFWVRYTLWADYLATIFMLLNRWTAIKMPPRHKMIWRKYLIYATIIIYGLPFISSFEHFFINAINQIDTANGDNSNNSFFIKQESQPSLPINAMFSSASMLICIFINIAILLEYRKHQQITKTQTNQKKVDTKLLAYALITFVGHIIMAFYYVLIYVAGTMKDNPEMIGAVYTQYPWMNDFGSVVLPSWLLFWASGSFRSQMIADFLPKFCRKMFKKNMTEIETTPVISLKNETH